MTAVHTLAQHAVAEHMYRKIRVAFGEAGIEHLILKGPHLTAIAYVKPWERGFNDLDILVREQDFETAVSTLVDAGFSFPEPKLNRKATAESTYDRSLLAPSGSVVEIHRAFAPHGLYALDYDGLFDRARDFRFGSTPARGLAPEDLLVHLVIHAAKSQFSLIERKHIRDVKVLVEAQEPDWDTFLQRAGEADCRRAAWVMFSAGVKVHGAKVPERVLKALRPGLILRWWIDLWLTRGRFPVLRFRRMPKPLRRILLAPALCDRPWQLLKATARFGVVRARDVWGG